MIQRLLDSIPEYSMSIGYKYQLIFLKIKLVYLLSLSLLNTLLCTQLELSILFLDLLELRLEVDDRVQLLLEMLLE